MLLADIALSAVDRLIDDARLIGRGAGVRVGAACISTAAGSQGRKAEKKCENTSSHDAVPLQSGQTLGGVGSTVRASLFCAQVAQKDKVR